MHLVGAQPPLTVCQRACNGRTHPPQPAAVRRRPAPPCAALSGSNSGAQAPRDPLPGAAAPRLPTSLDHLKPESQPAPVQQPAPAPRRSTVKSLGGLRRAPLSGGVKTATARYDLPAPSVAVRNLVEQAQFAHLCTIMSHMHHRRAGYPFGTLVDFATDGAGMPIFCLSPLAIHARNLIEDSRCSLVVQMPGWTGLANARVTIFGDVFQLPPDMQVCLDCSDCLDWGGAEAREIFLAKQANERKERWVLGSFLFFRWGTAGVGGRPPVAGLG
ncbi:hypothetical protein MNEG_14525 [Monoraphidium neglectum]|uniref:CREG-like beta-barrel domain-containing protein n=1 Tax=Monoraphidium neglectum TaxID=145388 RepID=A0A0D2LUY2_9CHLO|nr:hypothetical protein MNEG_14525 [Monoraphidium neglectum]KIY93436.1 hypothetical protein MNEG_14525 [Monoraphidium neglectum]|eukprot:XP_013892456.1 hypothetical protein MNEG_14525 [Monoraphidium neglectum]